MGNGSGDYSIIAPIHNDYGSHYNKENNKPIEGIRLDEKFNSQGNHYYADLIVQQHAQNLQRMQQQTLYAGSDPQAAAPQPPTTNSPQAQGSATPAQAPQGWDQQLQGGVPATTQGWGQAAPQRRPLRAGNIGASGLISRVSSVRFRGREPKSRRLPAPPTQTPG